MATPTPSARFAQALEDIATHPPAELAFLYIFILVADLTADFTADFTTDFTTLHLRWLDRWLSGPVNETSRLQRIPLFYWLNLYDSK
jgi:hypothetical protein